MNRVDAIFLDLDGTLFNAKKEVSVRNQESLKKCMDQGIDVYLISGRPIFFVEEMARQMDARVHAIGFNGAYYRLEDTLYDWPISDKDLKKLIQWMKLCSIEKYYIKGDHALYCSDDDPRFTYDDLSEKINLDVFKNVQEFSNFKQAIYKVLVIDLEPSHLQQLVELCKDDFAITSSHAQSLDITCKGVDKGKAIQQIASLKGYAKEHILCMGDGLNDQSMLEQAGYKVVMGNGHERLKEMADLVTDTNEKDGVAKAIEQIVFK